MCATHLTPRQTRPWRHHLVDRRIQVTSGWVTSFFPSRKPSSTLLEEVRQTRQSLLVTRHGKPVAEISPYILHDRDTSASLLAFKGVVTVPPAHRRPDRENAGCRAHGKVDSRNGGGSWFAQVRIATLVPVGIPQPIPLTPHAGHPASDRHCFACFGATGDNGTMNLARHHRTTSNSEVCGQLRWIRK
jgi:antitoxin (DNA-binding transcriptional repressor) of toxin-antitoxin stability system